VTRITTDDSLAVTEYGLDARVVCRYEWIRFTRYPVDAVDSQVERTITDSDEQIVDRQSAGRMPTAPRSSFELIGLLSGSVVRGERGVPGREAKL
jgi:hypothetical protein